MLMLFKGQLSVTDILYRIPNKLLREMRDEKIRMLEEEQKEMENSTKEQQRQMARDQILAP